MTCARPLLAALACALALAACGDGEQAAEVRPLPTGSLATPSTTAPASGPTGPTATPATPPPASGSTGATGTGGAPAGSSGEDANPGGASAEEASPGGAGDEEPIRQPARFELGSVTLRPSSVSVAPFLAVELTVHNVDEGVHRVKLVGTDVAFAVQGGETETRRLEGLPAGGYTLSVDGGEQAAMLVVGDEAGP